MSDLQLRAPLPLALLQELRERAAVARNMRRDIPRLPLLRNRLESIQVRALPEQQPQVGRKNGASSVQQDSASTQQERGRSLSAGLAKLGLLLGCAHGHDGCAEPLRLLLVRRQLLGGGIARARVQVVREVTLPVHTPARANTEHRLRQSEHSAGLTARRRSELF